MLETEREGEMERTTSRRQQGGHWRKSALFTREEEGGGSRVGGGGGGVERTTEYGSFFVCFPFLMFQQSVQPRRQADRKKERETPTEQEGYCRRGSGGGGRKHLPSCVALLVCGLFSTSRARTHTHGHTHGYAHTHTVTHTCKHVFNAG